MYKIETKVPVDYIDTVKTAMFSAGGGRIGDYHCCSSQWLVEGQFCPVDNAKPFIGALGKLEKIREYHLEIVCSKPDIHAVKDALVNAHPYEEPAYFITEMVKI